RAGSRRQELLGAVARDLKPLKHFHDAMCSPLAGAPVPLRHVLRRLVDLRDCLPELSAIEKERVPTYGQWCEHRDRSDRLTTTLPEVEGNPILANHPLKHLTTRLVGQERPLEKVLAHLQNAEKLLDSLDERFRGAGLSANDCDTVAKSMQVVSYAEQLGFLAQIEQLSLLRPSSDHAKSLAGYCAEYRKKAGQLEEARRLTHGWIQKLPSTETATALDQARAFRSSVLSFLKPSWWRLRGTLRRCYDFRSHQIRPT